MRQQVKSTIFGLLPQPFKTPFAQNCDQFCIYTFSNPELCDLLDFQTACRACELNGFMHEKLR